MKLNWFITVADEHGTLRTIHPPAFTEAQQIDISCIIAEHVTPVPIIEVAVTKTAAEAKKMLPVKEIDNDKAALMTQSEIAREQGFTGDACEQCHSFSMVRTGTCETCQKCGWNKGCG